MTCPVSWGRHLVRSVRDLRRSPRPARSARGTRPGCRPGWPGRTRLATPSSSDRLSRRPSSCGSRLVAQLGQVAGAVEHRRQHRLHAGPGLHDRAQLVHHLHERGQAGRGPGRQPRDVVQAGERGAEADPLVLGVARHQSLRAVPDPPLGHVDDAPQVDRVVRVGQRAQVGHGVLDLAALVEPRPPDHDVGHPGTDEHLLHRPGLVVGPVEDRHVGVGVTVRVAQPVDLLHDEGGLVVLGVRDVADDLVALAGRGPQPLVLAAGVARDDGVGGVEDGLRRTVVLLEEHDVRVRVVRLELLDVADGGTAEGVDRLVGVADDRELAGRHRRRGPGGQRRLGVGELAVGARQLLVVAADQLAHQRVLGVVGVLVLVDQHVPEAAAVVLRHLRERLEQVDHLHDQVVEVHGVRLAQAAGVAPVHVEQHQLVGCALRDLCGVVVGVDELVLERGDAACQGAGRVAAWGPGRGP